MWFFDSSKFHLKNNFIRCSTCCVSVNGIFIIIIIFYFFPYYCGFSWCMLALKNNLIRFNGENLIFKHQRQLNLVNNCIEKNRRICMRTTWKENKLKRKHIIYSVQRTHTVSSASLKCMPWQLWNCSLYCLLLIKLNRVQLFFRS